MREFFSHSFKHVLSNVVDLGRVVSEAWCLELAVEFLLTLSYFSNSSRSSFEQFLPMGEMLIMPFRNSINVPLQKCQKYELHLWTRTTYRLSGISRSARYRIVQLTIFLYSASPTCSMNEFDGSDLPNLNGVKPFSPRT